MSFLNPFLFIAFIAVAIPVIIHFINLRKPHKVSFSTLSFFQELQKSTIRRLNIKRFLLLALRVLAITMLVLALARPFIPPHLAGWMGTSDQGNLIAIMIDNGPSMKQIDESGPYMDQARSTAKEIIEQSDDETRFLLIPTHGELQSGQFMRRAEALRILEQFEPVNKGAYPAERLQFIYEKFDEEPGDNGIIYWISDARKTQLERLQDHMDPVDTDAENYPATFIRIGNESFQNVSVVSVETTGQVLGEGIPVGISVTVRNFSSQAVHNSYLSLEMDGERIGQYEVDLQGEEEKDFLFEVIPESAGSIRGKALLEGGTYTFDHTRYFSVEVPESRRILLVHDEGEDDSRRSYLKPLLDAVSQTGNRIQTAQADISDIRDYELEQFDAVILEELIQIPDFLHAELVQYVQQGNGLLFIPSEQGSMERYNRLLRHFQAGNYTGMRGSYGRFEEIASLQMLTDGHLLIDDVFEIRDEEEVRIDMPSIYHYWQIDASEGSDGTTILRTNLDEPLFVKYLSGDGMIMVGAMGFGPGWSNLSLKPIYAPMVYRMILYVVAWEDGGVREHILGSPFDRRISDFGTQVTMTINGDEIRPETATITNGLRIRYPAREWSPGWLVLNIDGREYTMAVNQSISESDFTSLSLVETEELLEKLLPVAGVIDVSGYNEVELRSAMATISFGREIWNWFIWFALAFLVAECIISRLYRTETPAD